MSINWIKDGKVEVGTICDAQGNQGSLPMDRPLIKSLGILTSVGEAIVAMTTVVNLRTNLESSISDINNIILQIIAVYTFIGMWTMKSLSSLKTALGVVCGIWCFVGLLAIMGIVRIHNSSDDRFATPTPVSLTHVYRHTLTKNPFPIVALVLDKWHSALVEVSWSLYLDVVVITLFCPALCPSLLVDAW